MIRRIAALEKLNISDFIRKTVIESIEDKFDLEIYDCALAEYEADPITFTHEEMKKMLLDE